MNQLKYGIKIESEHKDVMLKIRKFIKKNKKMPINKKVFTWIAETHLKEDPKYYIKLKKARL